MKSLVWYSPENFREAGYEIPQTMEELHALTDRIVEDGETPWCIGLGAGAGTGWPATDWVEDLMLRTVPVEVYDQWTAGEIPFDDPRVVAAIEEYGRFAREPDYTPQGPEGVASTDFRDSPDGLFEFPPECYMHKQASFIPNFFPEDVVVGEDVDFFYFPAYEDQDLGQPILGSGGLISITRDAPVTRAFVDFFRVPIAPEVMLAQGQFLTPHLGANKETLRDRDPSGAGRDPDLGHDLSLRRLGPDARRDRHGGVLDRHGGLHHRQECRGRRGRRGAALEPDPLRALAAVDLALTLGV